MTKTLLSSFTGGAIGTNPTTATETWASSAGGTEANMTYQAGIAGTSGQSVEVTGARDLVWTPSGSHWRLGVWAYRVSGTQSSGQACILLRSSTTNRGDLFLRNQNGGQFALRAGSGGTTYAGQSGTTIANGDVWWVELEYDNTDVTVYLWEPGNTTGTPDDTFTSTTAAAVDNVRLFNPTGSTGLTMRFGELWTSDGEQIRSGSGGSGALTLPALTVSGVGTFVGPPTLHYNLGGGPTADGFTVTARTSGASSCRIKASTTSDLLTSPVFSGAVSPDADGYVHISISGLSSGTKFYWGLEVDGELDTSMNGAVWTLTPSGTPTSIVFTSTSCHDWTGSTVFGLALTRFEAIESRIHVMLGDLGYPWITASGSPIAPSDVAQLRAARLNEFEASNVMAFYRSRALSYTYSDGDGAGANSDGTWPGFTSNAVQTAYRQQVPLPDMPLADVQARSWVDGNWRFIQTDELTVASARGATDNASKTKLGAAQKAWFKAELLAAKAARQSVIWLGDGPWVGSPSVGGTLQEWRAYNTERVELGNFIASNGMTDYLIRVHGDTHALAADDGTNNPYGGFAFISAAPFGTVAQVWGSTTTNGRWPDVSASARQHGEYTLTDTGTTRTLVFSGRAWDAGTSSYVERVTMTLDLTPPPAVVGAGTLGLPALSVTGEGVTTVPVFTGAGALGFPAFSVTGEGTTAVPVYTGAGSVDLPAFSVSGSGDSAMPVFTGEGVLGLPALTVTGVGTVENPPGVTGSGVITLPSLDVSGTGVTTVPVFSGSGAILFPPLEATGEGSVTIPAVTGVGTIVFPALVVTGTGGEGVIVIPDVRTLTPVNVDHTLTPVSFTRTLEDA